MMPQTITSAVREVCCKTAWIELHCSPGYLHNCTWLSSVSKMNLDSSLNTRFCQSVVFPIALAWHHCRMTCWCFGVKGSMQKGHWWQICFHRASRNGLWNNRNFYIWLYCGTSQCGIQECLLHDPSIHLPHHLPGHCRPGVPHVGMISCLLLSTSSDGTFWMIDIVSSMAHQPLCSFHVHDETPLKLVCCCWLCSWAYHI